jgi:hypothetical protein
MNWRQLSYVLYQTTRASFLAEEKSPSLGLVWHQLNPILMTAIRGRVEKALVRYPSGSQIVLHASHDDDLIIRTCLSATWIGDSEVRCFGETEEVLARYRRNAASG